MVRIPFGRFGLLGAIPSLLIAASLAAPRLAAQQSVPETHTVRTGDTLWDLARRYLGDPFLWPEIYRLNTSVVEDPHWIYPDEVLRLRAGAGGEVSAVPDVDTPIPAPRDSAAPAAVAEVPTDPTMRPGADDWKKFFTNPTGAVGTLGTMADRPYRALRRGEFHSSGFLTEGRDLNDGELLGPVTPSQIRATSVVVETAALFTDVHIRAPRGTTYKAGDSLLVVRLGSSVSGYGRVVIPTGMLRVTEVASGRTVATVIAVYRSLEQGDRLLPVEPFTPSGTKRAAPVADGVEARVLLGPSTQVLKGTQDVLFLDKGSRDGVAVGDIFEVRRAPTRRHDGARNAPELMAILQVVRAGERSATAKILSVRTPDIADGTGTRQVGKLPT